jgi:Tfp pilus assembly protein PilX
MQRKNSILNRTHKNGMALIMAIAVIVIIATIMALSMALTTQTTKRTNDLYLYEQATLLSKSAAEYALLRIAQDGPCTHTNDLIFTQDSIYDVNISLRYIYMNPSPCTAAQTYTIVNTPEQNGSILIDVAVSVTDPTVTTEPIRYFRRTIQKL